MVQIEANTNDWRVALFGPLINMAGDEEVLGLGGKKIALPVEEAFDKSKYDYIAVFVGADHCKYCEEFAPAVVKSSFALETKRKCKVVFVSGDRSEEAFEKSCNKLQGIDTMPFDIARAKTMRDLFKIKTIPALLILRNDNFGSSRPVVVTNARHLLSRDPTLELVAWKNGDGGKRGLHPVTTLTLKERIFKENYGGIWQFGHTSINPAYPEKMYMDEHVVRIRAGLFNIISWIAIGNVLDQQLPLVVYTLGPLVIWEFLSTLMFGFGPWSSISILAQILTHVFQPTPHWKPARIKQFAWSIGFCLATLCLSAFALREELNAAAGMNLAFPIICTME
uniref:Thioredoxin domain-containing protein n=1 Tax=Pseudo-nitzschia australis TaxID=44445 RepID=A0A6U9ZYS8_9STRA|mmetsp:Transcript_10518/g.22432  ORF Transcript_10518/g.22432 Transcript_10518/m.22432 type:complete len:337 (-) Transcript_10518:71-1081(-)